MNPVPLRAVVDASVGVKIFVPEALSAQAQTVFMRFASENDAELIVPDLFFIECANVLLPLITADEKLATKVAKGSCEVRWLGDIEAVSK